RFAAAQERAEDASSHRPRCDRRDARAAAAALVTALVVALVVVALVVRVAEHACARRRAEEGRGHVANGAGDVEALLEVLLTLPLLEALGGAGKGLAALEAAGDVVRGERVAEHALHHDPCLALHAALRPHLVEGVALRAGDGACLGVLDERGL